MRRRSLLTVVLAAAAATPAAAQGVLQQLVDRLAATGRGADVFVQIANTQNNFAIESGRVLLAGSAHPQIRDFAQRMIDQHGAMSALLIGLPEASTRVGGAMDDEQTRQLLTLRGAENADMLNRFYVDQQIAALEQAVRAYATYAENGEVPALKSYAQRFLPTLRDNLEAARALQAPRIE